MKRSRLLLLSWSVIAASAAILGSSPAELDADPVDHLPTADCCTVPPMEGCYAAKFECTYVTDASGNRVKQSESCDWVCPT